MRKFGKGGLDIDSRVDSPILLFNELESDEGKAELSEIFALGANFRAIKHPEGNYKPEASFDFMVEIACKEKDDDNEILLQTVSVGGSFDEAIIKGMNKVKKASENSKYDTVIVNPLRRNRKRFKYDAKADKFTPA